MWPVGGEFREFVGSSFSELPISKSFHSNDLAIWVGSSQNELPKVKSFDSKDLRHFMGSSSPL